MPANDQFDGIPPGEIMELSNARKCLEGSRLYSCVTRPFRGLAGTARFHLALNVEWRPMCGRSVNVLM